MTAIILVIGILIAFALGILLERAAGQRQLQAAVNAALAPLQSEKAAWTERETHLKEKIQDLNSQLESQQKALTTEFENIAGRILKANAESASATSRKELDLILKPLQQRIQDFQAKVETTYRDESREVISLKEQIKMLLQTSQAVGDKADSLAHALRNDSQQRGRWGEIVLERILEAAGLCEGREFVTQGRGLGLENEQGGRQKPDVIILMPEGRCVIVDSKLPLLAFDRLTAAPSPEEAAQQADALVRDVKRHMDDLASKQYQLNEQILAHEYVLMFVPLEGALAAALNREPGIFNYGFEKRIVLVGPATLLMTLQTVARLWRYERQNQNAREIARLAGAMCAKLSDSLADFNDVAASMQKALAQHNQAVKRLATGKGNILSLGQRVTELGASATKPLPPVLVDGVDVSPAAELDELAPSDAAPPGAGPGDSLPRGRGASA